MKFCTVFSPPPKAASPHGGVSLTDKSALRETDINEIVRRYTEGDTSPVRQNAFFADVSEVGDFADAMRKVKQANADFAALPSNVRDRFGNDPLALVKFLADSANDDEAVALGLKVRSVPEKSVEERIIEGVTAVVNKAASPASSGDGRATPTT